MNYNRYLDKIYSEKTFNPGKEDTILYVAEQMQKNYPGNYVVQEYYDFHRMAFKAKLVFDKPEDETMFILRYQQ